MKADPLGPILIAPSLQNWWFYIRGKPVIVLFVIFVVVPILEISLLIQVGNVLGGLNTIALVILTALLGASLVRSQGLRTLMSLQQRISAGEQPAQEIIEGVMLAIAGVLLVTPGFVTDTLGLVFLTPWSRRWLAQQGVNKIKLGTSGAPFAQRGQSFHHDDKGERHSQGETLEGEFQRKDDDKLPK